MVWVPALEQAQPVAAGRRKAHVEIAAPRASIQHVPAFLQRLCAALLQTKHAGPIQHFVRQKDGGTAHDPETPSQPGAFPATEHRPAVRHIDH